MTKYNVNEIVSGAVISVATNLRFDEAFDLVRKGGLVTFEQDGDNFDVLTKEGAQYTIEPVKGE